MNVEDTALIKACEVHNLELVEYIAKKNLNIDQQINDGQTALYRTVRFPADWSLIEERGYGTAFKMVKILLKLGADPNIPFSDTTHQHIGKHSLLFYTAFNIQKKLDNYWSRAAKLLVLNNAKLFECDYGNLYVVDRVREINKAIEDETWPKVRLLVGIAPTDLIKQVYEMVKRIASDDIQTSNL